MLTRIEIRTRLHLAGLVNSDVAHEPRRGHGHCSSPAVILIQISYLDPDLRRQPCPAKRFPGHGTLGADPARLGNRAEGNLCLGMLPMLKEESLGSWCADTGLGRGTVAEACLVPLVYVILPSGHGQKGNSDSL